MKTKFVLALMLASGLAFAQGSGTSPGSTDQQPAAQQPPAQQEQQPQQQPPEQQEQQPQPQQPQEQQPQEQQPQQPTEPAATGPGATSMRGCLQQSGEEFMLVTAEGQSTPIKGDSDTLKQHNGHQVQVNGSHASDGSFQVTDVVMISDTCEKPQAKR